jgi:nitrite reductase/ring-hydroxylating ferredoxin subunit
MNIKLAENLTGFGFMKYCMLDIRKGIFCCLLFAVMIFSVSCKKDLEEIIPNKHFTARIYYINQDPRYTKETSFVIKHDSNGKLIGLEGVVVYMLTSEEYYVFDLMCPYEKQISCLVDLDENDNIQCICPCCGSVFLIAAEYGSVISGPSKWPLKRYNTEVRGDHLYISN